VWRLDGVGLRIGTGGGALVSTVMNFGVVPKNAGGIS
jgi:hypothetical protein